MGKRKVYALVIYDIVDDRRRSKFAKTLNKYGIRVQKSAYETWVSMECYKKMLCEIMRLADDEDSVRVYRLTLDCKLFMVGKNPVLQRDTVCFL